MGSRHHDTLFTRSLAAPTRAAPTPADQARGADPAPVPARGRTNRHTHRPDANGDHGTRAHVDGAAGVRALVSAPVVVPALAGSVGGAVLVVLVGPAALVALPAPIVAALLGAAYGLGRAHGADERHTRAVLESGPGARLAHQADQDTGGAQ